MSIISSSAKGRNSGEYTMANLLNAEAYLLDFCKNCNDELLNFIIYNVIQNRDITSVQTNNLILNCFLNNEKIPNLSISTTNDILCSDLRLKRLTHHTGVNALIPEQTINFCGDLTILFGLNGSGKSGYYRILHEIIGGKQKHQILTNIYSVTITPISVTLVYEFDKSEKTVEWDGKNRAYPDFSSCKVFDSHYVSGLLAKRDVDETLVMPLGLNLFQKINLSIEEIQKAFTAKKNELINAKGKIDNSLFLDEKKNIFEQNELNEAQVKQIQSLLSFSHDSELESIEAEIKNLEQLNNADTIKLESHRKDVISEFSLKLKMESQKYKKYQKEAHDFLLQYSSAKKNSDDFLRKVEVLKSIPASNTPEWKIFIQSAAIYKQMDIKLKEICPYCHQRIDADEPRNLIKAYEEFLSNEAEKLLSSAIEKINDLKNRLLQSPLQFETLDMVKEIIASYTKARVANNENGIDILGILQSKIDIFRKLHTSIITHLDSRIVMDSIEDIDSTEITNNMDFILAKLTEHIQMLSADNDTKKQKIIDFKKRHSILTENKEFSRQKETIEKWLDIDKQVKKISKQISTLSQNMKAISKLSGVAHEGLLTENLKKAFREELDSLGYCNLHVDIIKANTVRGRSSTELIIRNQRNINEVLSEGEQKAVALAIFIAEIKLYPSKSSLIFDDPVNSLDHKIAAEFASRLMNLSQQVIIFTHNRLFLDAFECNSEHHVCKTMNGACSNAKGRHIQIYEIRSEGISQKGVIFPVESKMARRTIDAMQSLLKESPFNDGIKVSSMARKTIEYIIDEKILNNVTPTKYANKNTRIQWEAISKINPAQNILDKLKKFHSRLSGGDLHNGTEFQENPITKEELQEIVNELEKIYL